MYYIYGERYRFNMRNLEKYGRLESCCPNGGDTSNDCADCVYSGDYHFENGECVRRKD